MALQEGEEQTGKENQNIPNDELLKLVKKLTDKVDQLEQDKVKNGPVLDADAIVKIIEATRRETDKDLDYNAGIKVEDIPKDDWEEKGVRFCAPFAGYCLVDDIRKGQRVILPYNKRFIFFEYGATRRMQQGKYEGVSVYSAYTSHSKKEIEWIRNHSKFGIYFYESSTEAMNADAQKAARLSRIMTVLNAYEMDSLLKRCKEYGVAMGEDAAVMRSHLAFKMMEAEIKLETLQMEKNFQDQYKTQLMLEGKDVK
jgi:hypothetical protein